MLEEAIVCEIGHMLRVGGGGRGSKKEESEESHKRPWQERGELKIGPGRLSEAGGHFGVWNGAKPVKGHRSITRGPLGFPNIGGFFDISPNLCLPPYLPPLNSDFGLGPQHREPS